MRRWKKSGLGKEEVATVHYEDFFAWMCKGKENHWRCNGHCLRRRMQGSDPHMFLEGKR